MSLPRPTIFLLSPARCGSARAAMLIDSHMSDIGQQLRSTGAPLGDVFAWLSALYFRGKLAYARRFATPPEGRPGSLVITPGLGLQAAETRISADELRAMGTIDLASDAFITPLRRDAARLDRTYGRAATIVLLGSIATGKYVDTLLAELGPRLLFPEAFVGRGDMSRGGLLLRATLSGDELTYKPIAHATLHGPRAPRLPRLHRQGLT